MLGRIKKINNKDKIFGAWPVYFYLRVQSGLGDEEPWLLTTREREVFKSRASRLIIPECSHFWSGHWSIEECSWPKYPEVSSTYYIVHVVETGGEETTWAMTGSELEVIRKRAERNHEDIKANEPSWIEDLFD